MSPTKMTLPNALKRPNFFVIGTEKAGTTAIAAALGRHPEIFMSEPKEPHFFSDEVHWASGLDSYERLFSSATDRAIRGEGSVTYSYFSRYEKVISRIRDSIERPLFIYVLRNPVSRIESVYRMLQSLGRIPAGSDINQLVRNEKYLINNCRYWPILSAYRKAFGEGRIRVVFYEDFVADPQRFMEGLQQFLGVERIQSLTVVRENGPAPYVDGGLLRRIRPLIHSSGMQTLIPPGIRGAIARLMRTQKVEMNPKWDDAVKSEIWAELAEETALVLRYAGKPGDFWT